MSRLTKKGFWPVVCLMLAVAYFAGGRTGTVATPGKSTDSAIRRPSRNSPAPDSPTGVDAQSSKPTPKRERTSASTVPLSNERRQLLLRVVGVHDGDTITGLDENNVQHKIRLDAIDAPELGQPFGQAAKKALSGKVFGKNVLVIVKTRDKYGRTVGHVLVEGRDVNLELLEEGMAWHYEKYDSNNRLTEAEKAARTGRLGLWVDGSTVVPPWDWRSVKQKKSAAEAKRGPVGQ